MAANNDFWHQRHMKSLALRGSYAAYRKITEEGIKNGIGAGNSSDLQSNGDGTGNVEDFPSTQDTYSQVLIKNKPERLQSWQKLLLEQFPPLPGDPCSEYNKVTNTGIRNGIGNGDDSVCQSNGTEINDGRDFTLTQKTFSQAVRKGQPEPLQLKTVVMDKQSLKSEERTYDSILSSFSKLSLRDTSDVVVGILENGAIFQELLNKQLEWDLINVMMTLLAKVCQSIYSENKVVVLANACQKYFMTQLLTHTKALSSKTGSTNITLKSFGTNVVHFYGTVIGLLPSIAVEYSDQMFIETIDSLKKTQRAKNIDFTEEIEKLDNAHARMKRLSDKLNTTSKNNRIVSTDQYTHPQGNFREMSLFPSTQDVLGDPPNNLQSNIVRGPYINVDHYLDVQFRLMREDFVNPLREGLSNYLKSRRTGEKVRSRSVKIYNKVKFLRPEVTTDKVGILMSFDPDNCMKRSNLVNSKRLMFGALLLFTHDNFKTIFFGTVIDRDARWMEEGKIVVDIANGSDAPDRIYARNFLMAESEVFFDPYYHIMKAFQNMEETRFPMSQYIVDVQTNSGPPKYVVPGNTDYAARLMNNVWSSAEDMKFNKTQHEAYKMALTKEFAVIQGPPGTGKTFVGLKIASTLISNASSWKDPRSCLPHSPILVVCFTNHALDQFLEGLLLFTQDVVRVGGQSKNKNLEEFTLKEKRRTCRKKNKSERYHAMLEKRKKLTLMMKKMKSLQEGLELIINGESIISLSSLENIIGKQQMQFFKDKNDRISDVAFLGWLWGDSRQISTLNISAELASNSVSVRSNSECERLKTNSSGNEPIKEIEGERMLENVLGINLSHSRTIPSIYLALDLRYLKLKMESLLQRLGAFDNQSSSTRSRSVMNVGILKEQLEEINVQLKCFETGLKRVDCVGSVKLKSLKTDSLWELDGDLRWTLYHTWVDKLRKRLLAQAKELQNLVNAQARMYEEYRQFEDLELMRDAMVVGMTTTGAARLQTILKELRCKIVIVEEAAEVLESHIIVSLTEHCEHLILIGDHQQLRPSTADYKIGQKYHFDVSLFERMLNNSMNCEVLKVQHRMRPEIARLITPAIYPELHNHESVLGFDRILGVTKNMFFITHDYPEENMIDTMSKKNKHEASFMIALCNHLVKNGYPPDKITVLATYSGQMFYMKKEQNNYDMLTDVAITGVDNFQGEENDIILLSLVRSNEEDSIGFLSSENRVCVALSRAKKGFFIIGNMELLSRHSKLWDKIKQQLYEDKAIGQQLTLRCEAHLDQISQVATSEDFTQFSPEGGCLQTCDKVLGCGHVCLSKCHGYDHEHQGAKKCAHPCERIPPKCNMLHKCLKLCSEWCGDCLVIVKRTLLCGHVVKLQCGTDYKFYKCKVQVKVTLPLCGHLVAKPCHQDIDTVICSLMCETLLSCDHKCILKCHLLDDPDHILYKCTQPCTKLNKNCTRNHTCARMCSEPCGPCTHKVKKTPPGCDHSVQVLCSLDPAEIRCEKKCEKILPCGHICSRRCIDECGGCPVQVEKVVSDCGHNVKVKCYHTPTTKDCTQPCVKILVCGHPCTTRCCDVCTTRCTVMVQSLVNPACKHDCPIDIPCFLQTLGLAPNSVKILSYCGKQCEESLECKHTCRGTCGECMQGRVHVPCQETCNRRLICGHRCTGVCSDTCSPCDRECTYKCQHSQCENGCGKTCSPCKEQCPSSCEHSSCSRRCFEPCDREPCDQPCQNNLRCGHKCVGFCGDPCPPECRICDRPVSEVFKEFADDHEARFVLLECKHTIESRQLKKWLNSSGVSVKVCPRCNRPVTKSIRYKDLIIECYSDICKVRNHIMEQTAKMEKSCNGLSIKLDCLNLTTVQDIKWIKDSEDYKTLWKSLVECLTQDRRTKKVLGVRMDTETVSVLVEIITELVMSVRDSVRNFTYQQETTLKNQLDLILHVLAKQKNKISTQETQDLNLELKYFQRMIQFFNLESTTAYEARKNLADVTAQHSIAEQILSSDDKYSLIKDQKLNIIMQNFAKALNPASFMPYEVKKTITKNTGFREGCWYMCTNGHINAVQDFNIKRELGKCSRCGKLIVN